MNGEVQRLKERNDILRKCERIDKRLYPDQGDGPSGMKYKQLQNKYYSELQSYFDRLPRVRMATCPVCGAPFEHSFDPFGLDGPWWHTDRLCEVKEPANCPHFKLLLGAYELRRPAPIEAVENVQPGPEVPFVVPRLLRLPGMIAVIGELEMETGDVAYPIAYFSDQKIRACDLHASWCRVEYWFKDEHSNSCWTISNSPWDFELRPYLEDRRLRWVDKADPQLVVRSSDDGPCPYLDMNGTCLPQLFCSGERDLLELPTGEIICPFE